MPVEISARPATSMVLLSNGTPEHDMPSPMPAANLMSAEKMSDCTGTTRLSGASCMSSPAAPSKTSPDTPSVVSPGSPPVQQLEHLMTAYGTELANDSDIPVNVWCERVAAIPLQLESVCLCHGGSESASLVPAMLTLCKQLVHHGTKESALFEQALILVRAAKICFGPQVVQGLSSTGAVASFRAALQALAELQQVSKSSSHQAQKAAAPLLLELPPMLASIIDNLDAAVQLVAWIRVAAEILEDGCCSGTDGWALRFCARCVDRCAGNLSQGGADFPAWEVLSEVLRFHERSMSGPSPMDAVWVADCRIWRHSLEGAARTVSKAYPAQAREFLLLANCTGSPMPAEIERMLVQASE